MRAGVGESLRCLCREEVVKDIHRATRKRCSRSPLETHLWRIEDCWGGRALELAILAF